MDGPVDLTILPDIGIVEGASEFSGPVELRQASANSFTGGVNATTFVKVVDTDDDDLDPIELDIMNCLFLNLLVDPVGARVPHAVAINAACCKVLPSAQNPNKFVAETKFVASSRQDQCIPSDTHGVGGYIAIHMRRLTIDDNKIEDAFTESAQAIVGRKLADFLAWYTSVCDRFVFAHNDMHVGNVVWDVDADDFKLIDFGRSTFKDARSLMDRIRQRYGFRTEHELGSLGLDTDYDILCDATYDVRAVDARALRADECSWLDDAIHLLVWVILKQRLDSGVFECTTFAVKIAARYGHELDASLDEVTTKQDILLRMDASLQDPTMNPLDRLVSVATFALTLEFLRRQDLGEPVEFRAHHPAYVSLEIDDSVKQEAAEYARSAIQEARAGAVAGGGTADHRNHRTAAISSIFPTSLEDAYSPTFRALSLRPVRKVRKMRRHTHAARSQSSTPIKAWRHDGGGARRNAAGTLIVSGIIAIFASLAS